MLTALFRSAAAWTGIGLIGGLAYREVTKHAEPVGFTQLSFVHTHSLALGTMMLLVVLALAVALRLTEHRLMRWFLIVWNLGLTITVGMLAYKGVLQVQGAAWADSPALAGIAGLGHIILTVGFILLLVMVGDGVKAAQAAHPVGSQTSAPSERALD